MDKILVEGQHGTGGFIDSYDSRDLKLSEIAGATSPFNWQLGYDVEKSFSFKLEVKDQGQSFSCGGQAWAYLSEILEALSTGTYEPRSAKYIYAQTAVEGGGSYGRDNCAVLESQGVCDESVLSSYPNSETNLTAAIDITPKVREDARKAMFYPYAHAEPDIDSIAQAIRDHKAVVLGVDGQNNGTWTSQFPKPPTKTAWRHWVVATGAELINGKKHIKIINSWGESVGVKGRQWLSEDYFTTEHVFDNWTHIYKASPPPTIVFNTNLRYGMKNDEVLKLQRVLRQLGYFKLPYTTNYYGQETQKSVLAFQLEKGIIRFGIETLFGYFLGPKTREALNNLKVVIGT